MKENKRLYPISEEVFNLKALSIIEGDYIWKGSSSKVSHYRVLCGILYMLRLTRHLPRLSGRDVAFPRFKRSTTPRRAAGALRPPRIKAKAAVHIFARKKLALIATIFRNFSFQLCRTVKR
jgi:hypothetical protein